jgi:hypothetical protein
MRVQGAELDHLRQLRAEANATLVVVDSLGEGMVRNNLDENSTADVIAFAEGVLRPLVRDGAAVLVMDHVRKDAAGRWAKGSAQKLAVVDGVAYRLEPGEGFSRRGSGSACLRVAKDREGAVGPIDSLAAEIRFEVIASGDSMRIHLYPPPVDEGRTQRRARTTERRQARSKSQLEPEDVADIVAGNGGRLTFEQVRDSSRELFGLRRETTRDLLRMAERAGYLRCSLDGWVLAEPPEEEW